MRIAVLILTAALLASCRPIRSEPFVPSNDCPPASGPRKLMVFFDGTANTEASHTNVAKLRHMVSLQNRCDINTYYVEGVGTAGKILGGGTGWGMRDRVLMAYRWTGENYSAARGDSLFVFGFSRGAYGARIFAALTHVAGIPDMRYVPDERQNDFVRAIYDAYKGDMPMQQRRDAVKSVLGEFRTARAEIAFMGIFETVEAMGVKRPLRSRLLHWQEEDVEVPNRNYGDQLCNVKRASHAMSLDDNRAFIFTPILLTRSHLIADCPGKNIDSTVNEVWFSGAHSDVGGRKRTELDDVPLNWMISELRRYNLLRGDTIYADRFGLAENPRSGLAKVAYGFYHRNIPYYVDTLTTRYNGGRLKVHASVLSRLDSLPIDFWQNSWHTDEEFSNCFRSRARSSRDGSDSLYSFIGGPNCRVERIETPPGRR